MENDAQWRLCNGCKRPIRYGAAYYVCSVSTCNRQRTGLAFCSVACWDAHLPLANHREAWAEDRTAPLSAEKDHGSPEPKRRMLRSPAAAPPEGAGANEILIVASRLKEYISARSGFSTSDKVLTPLSSIVRRVCNQAIENTRRAGRQTVLDRDIPE